MIWRSRESRRLCRRAMLAGERGSGNFSGRSPGVVVLLVGSDRPPADDEEPRRDIGAGHGGGGKAADVPVAEVGRLLAAKRRPTGEVC